MINARGIASVLYEILKAGDTSGAYVSAPESIQLNRDKEAGELLDMVTLIEETPKRNLDGTFVHEKAEMIVEKCERQTHMSQGTKTDLGAINKEVTHLRSLKFIYFQTIMLSKLF